MVHTVILAADGLDIENLQKLDFDEPYMQIRGIHAYWSDNLRKPYTGQAWPSIYCGAGAEKHGITQKFALVRKKMPNFTELPPTIFDDLSREYKVSSFEMPITHPASRVSGWMVSGYPAGRATYDAEPDDPPSEKMFYSIDKEDIPDDYFDTFESLLWLNNDYDDLDLYTQARKTKNRFLRSLVEEDDEILFVGTQAIDRMSHFYVEKDWNGERPEMTETKHVKQGYRNTKQLLEMLRKIYRPKRMLVMSDHGGREDNLPHSKDSTVIGIGDFDVSNIDSVLDIRREICRNLGVEMVSEADVEQKEISEERRKEIKDKLENLGYDI